MNHNSSNFFEGHEYFVDEKVNFLKFANDYKIYNEKAEHIGMVKQRISAGRKLLTLIISKAILPFYMEIQDSENRVHATISRGWSFWLPKIIVSDSNGAPIAIIQQKFRFMKPKFLILDNDNKLIATILGDWKAWNFSIVDTQEQEVGTINKKWGGLAKEVFTSADKYNVSLKPNHFDDYKRKVAVLASAITIDMVLKESK